MEQQNKNPRFPEQEESEKIHGTTDKPRDSEKIEDLHSQDDLHKMSKKSDKNESTHLTDRSGEERKEDYINTDERKRDLDRRGL